MNKSKISGDFAKALAMAANTPELVSMHMKIEQERNRLCKLCGMSYQDAKVLYGALVDYAYDVAMRTPYANSKVWTDAWNEAERLMLCGEWDLERWKKYMDEFLKY